jgi:hypothetical protein
MLGVGRQAIGAISKRCLPPPPPVATAENEKTVAFSLTCPLYPFKLDSVMVDVTLFPTGAIRKLGFVEIEKSAGGATYAMTDA